MNSCTPRTCVYCVMDSSYPKIEFDERGQCNCCRDAQQRMAHEWWPGPEGQRRMRALVERLKSEGRGKPYDVMLGLSGGIDSAFLAHVMVREHGLRALAVHVDGGWNSEPAVRNIESLVRALDLDLHTYVVEWREMRDLQVSFLKASVLNQDIPQDHAFFSTLYRTAQRFGIRHFVSGVNFATESIVPPAWGHPSMDGKHLRAIHARFGTEDLKTFPVMGFVEYIWLTRVRKLLERHRPLDFIDYNKDAAQQILRREYGWRDYGGKHSESRFTKFYQDIYLPRRYGFDKRRLHLSSLIVSGQISRADALRELSTPAISPEQARRDLRFVAKKLSLTDTELEALVALPPIDHRAYPNQQPLHELLSAARQTLRRFR